VQNDIKKLELLIGEENCRVGMEEGDQLGRCLISLYSGAAEE
jgi:hypothetical protein